MKQNIITKNELYNFKSHDVVEVKCSKCDNIFKRQVFSIRVNVKRNGEFICQKCQMTSKDYIAKQKKSHPKTGSKWDNEVDLICSKCSKKLKIVYRSMMALKRKNKPIVCQSCSNSMIHKLGKYNKIYTQKFRDKLKSNGVVFWQDARATWKERFQSDEHKKLMSECGKRAWTEEFKLKMAEVRLNQPRTSSIQKILYGILDDLNIKYYDDKSGQCMIGYFTFDCRIDPQPGIDITKSILIEVQGDYWHSLKKTIAKDRSKATYIQRYHPQFNLKYLWEHEFNANAKIIEILKYWFGINKLTLIDYDFNNITIKPILAIDAEKLISKYHYAGRIGRNGITYGAYLSDILIATCIFAPIIRNEIATRLNIESNSILELSRFCIHPQYQKPNLASWFISRCLKLVHSNHPHIQFIITFADSSFNHDGIIYKAGNWKLDGYTEPDYWYIDNDGYVIHKKTLWNHASKMSMKESDYCQRYGYRKVYGDKKARFLWHFDAV